MEAFVLGPALKVLRSGETGAVLTPPTHHHKLILIMSPVTVRGMLLVLVLALASGCAAMGIEAIGTGKTEVYQTHINNFSVRHWQSSSKISAFEFSQARPEGALNATNQLVRLSSPSTNDIINLLGAPSEQGTNFIRYRTGKWACTELPLTWPSFPFL